MYLDVLDIKAFYGDRLGRIARRLIGARLKALWPSAAGQKLLGMGYATPYLRDLGRDAERAIAFMPAAQGVTNWPADGANLASLVADDSLPLLDASVDRVLVVHGLELAANSHELLREIWRVLAPGGRVIIVVPNRAGIWARSETTPFGHGRPFGRGQLTVLLRETLFSPESWSEALAVPPFRRAWVRTGVVWERIGRAMWPAFAGVIIVEATKQVYQGIPAHAARGRLNPALRPALIRPAG
jgi:SAM-dependent methyltransferase